MRRAVELLLQFYSGYQREGQKLKFKINNSSMIIMFEFLPLPLQLHYKE